MTNVFIHLLLQENVKLKVETGQNNHRDFFFLFDSTTRVDIPTKWQVDLQSNARSNENIFKVTKGTSLKARDVCSRRCTLQVILSIYLSTYPPVARGDPNGFLRAMRKTARSF